MEKIASTRWVVLRVLTFVLGAVLVIIPLPHGIAWFQPPWILLGVIGCFMYSPERPLGMGWVWLLGIINDLLVGGALGVRGLTMLGVHYMLVSYRYRVGFFSALAWFLLISVILCSYTIGVMGLGYLFSRAAVSLSHYGLSCLSGLLIAPGMSWLRRKQSDQAMISRGALG